MRLRLQTLLLMRQLGVIGDLESDLTYCVDQFPVPSTSVHIKSGKIISVHIT